MKQFDRRLIIAAIGMSLAATGSWAQTTAPSGTIPATTPPSVSTQQSAPAPSAEMPQPGMGKAHGMGGGKHDPSGQHEIGHLPQAVIDQLALSADQKAQLDTAQAARKEMRATRQAAMAARQKTMTEQLSKEQMDPRAILATNKQVRHDMEVKQDAIEQKWLTFWDGLTSEQRKTLTTFMKTRQASHQHKGPAPAKG